MTDLRWMRPQPVCRAAGWQVAAMVAVTLRANAGSAFPVRAERGATVGARGITAALICGYPCLAEFPPGSKVLTMRKTLLAAITISVMLSGCSWGIRLQSGGRAVRAAYVDSVAGCRKLGDVTVSVTDHVGPFDRNNLTVRDELEVLARNAGAGMGADTVKPLGAPVDGQQKWGAYRCGPAESGPALAPAASVAPPALPGDTPAQTLPLKTEPLQIQNVPASAGSSDGR